MSSQSQPSQSSGSPECWARFRFSVIGALLAAPAPRGQLQRQLQELAARNWRHPISGDWIRLGASTIERWYYAARNQKQDPFTVLGRKVRCDQGQQSALSSALCRALETQYRQHPSWSYQLHADNLGAQVDQDPQLGPMPSYDSIRRFMKAHDLIKRPRRGPLHSPGARVAEERYQSREIRGYESEHVNALWHLDFHRGSRRILLPEGRWTHPQLLGILDDHSRLGCHAQWYLSEGAEELCHGLEQALQKRALPRALMSDNGSAMIARETRSGLERLGIFHETTLPYSPYQNGKQEAFWNQIEGRLLPMLEGVADLTLAQLNQATQAWLEVEYNPKTHSELEGQSPLERYLEDRDLGRECPSTQELRIAFTAQVLRTQRRSDGTFSLQGRRFEVPSAYRHFQRLNLRFASWDLGHVYLADPQTGAILRRLYPQDKAKNAVGRRAPKTPLLPAPELPEPGMAPLLAKIIRDYATTGVPPAYVPKDELSTPEASDS